MQLYSPSLTQSHHRVHHQTNQPNNFLHASGLSDLAGSKTQGQQSCKHPYQGKLKKEGPRMFKTDQEGPITSRVPTSQGTSRSYMDQQGP